MTVIASALGHFTNLFIAKTSKSMTPEYERPFLRDNDESKRYRHCGEWARWLAVIAALGGIVAFCAGLHTAYRAFQHLAS
jgi:membrane protein YqaA with SNARE-associated domain